MFLVRSLLQRCVKLTAMGPSRKDPALCTSVS